VIANPQDVPPDLKITEQLNLARCPHCSTANPTIIRISQFQMEPHSPAHAVPHPWVWFLYYCTSCAGVICAATMNARAVPPNQLGALRGTPVQWLVPGTQSFDESIPARARTRLTGAQETISSPTSSIMTSASAVDWMLKEIGYKSGSLYSRIDQAVTDNRITADMGAWAHNVRLDANEERHADETAPEPKAEDAQRCLDFARTLADILFVLPARVRRGITKKTPAP
jgi:uncharacterized protein DUF4145